jgi:type I restriction enzyme M protein
MARIDDIGYDATGRMSVPEELAPNPPEVSETIGEFESLLGWR